MHRAASRGSASWASVSAVVSLGAFACGGAAHDAPRAPVPEPSSQSPAALSSVASDASAPRATTPVTIDWSLPEGWHAETIPFPLDFAPEIPYRGTEEIRFAPHFFDPPSPTYFTYAFAWVLESVPPPTAKMLAMDLKSYFSGLMEAVAKEKHAGYQVTSASVHVEGVDGLHYRGTVTTLDAFTDGRPVTLTMDARWTTCGSHPVLLVGLSPHPAGDATWTDLMAKRDAFRCTSI